MDYYFGQPQEAEGGPFGVMANKGSSCVDTAPDAAVDERYVLSQAGATHSPLLHQPKRIVVELDVNCTSFDCLEANTLRCVHKISLSIEDRPPSTAETSITSTVISLKHTSKESLRDGSLIMLDPRALSEKSGLFDVLGNASDHLEIPWEGKLENRPQVSLLLTLRPVE
jgi:hypothetical protein